MRTVTRSGRPPTGSKMGGQIQPLDRPMTQHGLGGMKTPTTRGGNRTVQDSTFWQGQIRAKMSELTTEIARLETELTNQEEEAESYLSYKRLAGQNATELADLQSRLADANMVIEKNNQGLDVDDIEEDIDQVKRGNEIEEDSLHNLFNVRTEKEEDLKEVEQKSEEAAQHSESLLAEMTDIERDQFLAAQKQFKKVSGEIDDIEREIEQTRIESHQLENDLLADPVRSGLVSLYADMILLKSKKKQYEIDERNKLTPEQERDKLLKQTKQDNSTISTIEKQIAAKDERLNDLHDELRNMESDLDESYLQKLKGLRQTEQKFKQFLDSYPQYKDEETTRLSEKEASIANLLDEIQKMLRVSQTLPDEARAFGSISSNLKHKERELNANENTMEYLSQDQLKLTKQLAQMDSVTTKLEKEKISLGEQIDKMSDQLQEVSNLKALEEREVENKETLQSNIQRYKEELQYLQNITSDETGKIKALEAELNESEEHIQMNNLEKKWNNQQQTNQAMVEFIQNRIIDTNGLQQRCRQYLDEYNQVMLDQLKGTTTKPTDGY